MKSYRKYAIRRIAFEMTQERVAEKAKCTLADVINFENGCGCIDRDVYKRIQYTIYLRTKNVPYVGHLLGRINEIAMSLKEETDKAEALKYIEHMEIELDRLREFYTKSLTRENEAK